MALVESALEIFNASKPYVLSFVGCLVAFRFAIVIFNGGYYREYLKILRDICLLTVVFVGFEPAVLGLSKIPMSIEAINESRDTISVPVTFPELLKKFTVWSYAAARFLFQMITSALIVLGGFIFVLGIMLSWYGLLKVYIVCLLITVLWPVWWFGINVLLSGVLTNEPFLNSVFIGIGELIKALGAFGVTCLMVLRGFKTTLSPIATGAGAGVNLGVKGLGAISSGLDNSTEFATGRRPIAESSKRVGLEARKVVGATKYGLHYGTRLAGASLYNSASKNYRKMFHEQPEPRNSNRKPAIEYKASSIDKIDLKENNSRTPIRNEGSKSTVFSSPRETIQKISTVLREKKENWDKKIEKSPFSRPHINDYVDSESKPKTEADWAKIYENSTQSERVRLNAQYKKKTGSNSKHFDLTKRNDESKASKVALDKIMQELDRDKDLN